MFIIRWFQEYCVLVNDFVDVTKTKGPLIGSLTVTHVLPDL